MNLNTALFVFALVAILVFIVARMIRIRTFSALILALIVGYIVMMTIYPISNVDGFSDGSSAAMIYLVIGGATVILTLIYLAIRIFQDRDYTC